MSPSGHMLTMMHPHSAKRRGLGDANRVWKAIAAPMGSSTLDRLRKSPRTTAERSANRDSGLFIAEKHTVALIDPELDFVERRERWNHLDAMSTQRLRERFVEPCAATWAHGHLTLESDITSTD